MRKIVLLISISLDGFAASPDHQLDWIVYNDEVEKYAHDLHSVMDTAIFGRATYEGMKSYWPTVPGNPGSTEAELAHANWLEDATKIVVSTTLDSSDWNKTVIIRENIADEMAKLKQQPGKDMWLLGSPTLAQTFMRLGLIDEYRINVNPVVLGGGIPLFANLDDRLCLKLVGSQTFKGGVVALRYVPEGA